MRGSFHKYWDCVMLLKVGGSYECEVKSGKWIKVVDPIECMFKNSFLTLKKEKKNLRNRHMIWFELKWHLQLFGNCHLIGLSPRLCNWRGKEDGGGGWWQRFEMFGGGGDGSGTLSLSLSHLIILSEKNIKLSFFPFLNVAKLIFLSQLTILLTKTVRISFHRMGLKG